MGKIMYLAFHDTGQQLVEQDHIQWPCGGGVGTSKLAKDHG